MLYKTYKGKESGKIYMYNESLCCTYETHNPVYFSKNFLNKKNLSYTNFSDDTKNLKKTK